MDTVALEAQNNESFVFHHEITAWSQLYPLEYCEFKAQLRATWDNPLVLYEWSFENNNLTIFLQPAKGTLSFATNPVAGNAVTIGTTFVTFVASGAVGNQVNIGGSASATATAFVSFASTSMDSAIASCSYSANGTLVTLTYNDPGGMGNSLAIASNSANIITSGTTLTGGAAVTEMIASRESVRRFYGAYAYDFKLYFQGKEVVLFGGALDFAGGVTL